MSHLVTKINGMEEKETKKNNSKIHILRKETLQQKAGEAQLSCWNALWLCGARDTELWWHWWVQWHLSFSYTARAKAEPPKERTDVLSCWTAADQAPDVFLWKETESNRVSPTVLKIFSLDKTKSQHKQWLYVSSDYINRNFCVNTEEGINWLKHDIACLCGFEQVASLTPQSDPRSFCSSMRVSWDPPSKSRVQVCKAFWQWRLLWKNNIRLFTVDQRLSDAILREL